MKKNLFLTFCFSWIPGAAQMYQGYMKRGVSLMVLFAVSCALVAMVPVPILGIPIPIIYAFAFFDSYNLRAKIGTDKEERDICVWDNVNTEELLAKFHIGKKSKVVGTLLIVIGIYILLNTVFSRLAYQYDLYFLERIIDTVTSFLPPILIAAISIVIGVKFLSKDK